MSVLYSLYESMSNAIIIEKWVRLRMYGNGVISSLLFSMGVSKKQLLILGLCLGLSIWVFQGNEQPEEKQLTSRLLAINYTTTVTRTSSVNKYCSGLTRSTLVDASLSSQYSLFNSQISGMLSLDGNALIGNVLSGNFTAAQTQIQSSGTQLGMFVGPFAVGLVLILTLSPFIMCCCACPQSCPSRCCRKKEDEQYSKCELYWPVAVLVLSLLLCIGACIAGFSQSQSIPTTMTSVSCASSIILDDMLNGNVTQDGSSFFVGLYQLNQQLGFLKSNLTTINTTMANLQSSSANMTAVSTAATNALTNIAKIPNNVNAGGNMTAITYNTPFNAASTTGTITSTFPSVLGSSTTGGIVGSLYTTTTAVNNAISAIATAAGNFVAQATTFSTSVAALQTTISNFTSFISSADSSFGSSLATANSNTNYVLLGVKVLYGLAIGLSSLMLLGALLVAFCDKTGCRHLVYVSCFFLFFLGVLGFALSTLFSVVVPAVYFGCEFMSFSLSSSANFNSNFGSLLSDATIRGYVSTCLPSSSGNLVTALGGTAVSAIQNLSNTLTGVSAFNTTYQSQLLLSAMTAANSYIGNYQNGYTNDITDSASITILTKVSNASAYSACTTPAFATDSWIPSDAQNPFYLSCLISNGANATSANCSGANFAAATGGCKGCMDTISILNTATYTTKASVLTALGNRYPAAGCSTFNSELSNVWGNYYLLKSNAYAPVATRATTATNSINSFVSNITGTLNTTFGNAVTTLNNAAQSVADGKYGLVAGLNCRLIGEDFTTFSNTFCQSLFTVLYFSRLVIGCASFGILFAICCGPCTGVRFYKHNIRKLNSIDNNGLSDGDVEDITNTNFVKPKMIE